MVKGTQRCTSEGSDVHISSTVKVRDEHVIDRGARNIVHEEHVRPLATV